MQSKALSEYVYTTVAELASLKVDEVRGDDRLREDLGLDSLQSMELLSRVSEAFDIDPDMEEVMGLSTVDDVVASLAQHVPTDAAAASAS